MRRVAGILYVAVLVLASMASAQEEKWASLFDGKSTAGWTNQQGKDPGRGWTAEDGILHLKGRGGDLYTAKEYGSFIFEFDFKIAAKGNSGVKYRTTEYGPQKEYLGLEYQILDDQGTGEGKNPKGSTAAIYVLFPAKADKPLKPAGEWNQGRIIARGTKIEHWLNGEKVAEADTASPEWTKAVAASKFKRYPDFGRNPSGRIMLQDHGSEVWFRNLRIQVLP